MKIEFLSYIITNREIKINLEKVRAIIKWPVPKSVKDVQLFLRFVNFYQRFVYKYSYIVALLMNILRR